MIFNPAHPGEVLRDYLGEMTVAEAAKPRWSLQNRPRVDVSKPATRVA
jgi:hypothetical protein